MNWSAEYSLMQLVNILAGHTMAVAGTTWGSREELGKGDEVKTK